MSIPSTEWKSRFGVVAASIIFMLCVVVWVSEYSITKEKADRLSILEAKVIAIQYKLQNLELSLIQDTDNGK